MCTRKVSFPWQNDVLYNQGENSVLKRPVLAEWLVRQSPTARADVTKTNNRISTQNSSPVYNISNRSASVDYKYEPKYNRLPYHLYCSQT